MFLPKKYHAIIFIGLLVMLLLLGLHLLGIGYSVNPATAKTAAALARNSTSSQTSSSSNLNVIQQPPAYRHPIVYDKLTGATNNQINDLLGSPKQPPAEYPIDHYQLQQQQQHLQQQLQRQQFNPLGPQPDDFLFNLQNQQPPPGAFPSIHQLSPHIPGLLPLPPPPHHHHQQMMTTQPPSLQQQLQLGVMPLQPLPPPPPQRQDSPADSLPSASSLNNNTSSNQQQAPPIYYTPPISAYNNFDQNRPLGYPSGAAQNNQGLAPFSYLSGGSQLESQRRGQQQPPMMLPEPPLSVDDYNARQARLRQQPIQTDQLDRYGSPPRPPPTQPPTTSPNLLADPQQQQRHRQQMLDRQLLFSNGPFPPLTAGESNLTSYYPPDRALYRPPSSQTAANIIRPPYAASQMPASQQAPPTNHRMIEGPPAPPMQSNKAPLVKSLPANRMNGALTMMGGDQESGAPLCARHQQEQWLLRNSDASNSSSLMPPTLFCQEDADYPTKEIMRALESYAAERPIEQLIPQHLIQIHLSQQQQPTTNSIQQQMSLDSLQPSINLFGNKDNQQLVSFDDRSGSNVNNPSNLAGAAAARIANIFPSASYEQLCKSSIFMSQPRRAKNLQAEWKVIVNLPGHKYRGIAISQMVRIEECSRPMGECGLSVSANPRSLFPGKSSRCLQHFESHRLVAWSHQQGLHVDIFRLPVACSCHIKKN